MAASPLILPILATGIAIASAGAGVAVLGHSKHTRILIPLSGALLIGVAVFGLIPELVADIGWTPGLLLVGFGYAILQMLDKVAVTVCPSCGHDHGGNDHGSHEQLHGFATPLLIATAIHAFVDGWGMVVVQLGARAPGATAVFATALLLHKIPEGLALGAMLRASVEKPTTALGLCAAVELATLAGGATGFWLTPAAWVDYPLAIAGGTFLFLGVHAVHGDWKRRIRHGGEIDGSAA